MRGDGPPAPLGKPAALPVVADDRLRDDILLMTQEAFERLSLRQATLRDEFRQELLAYFGQQQEAHDVTLARAREPQELSESQAAAQTFNGAEASNGAEGKVNLKDGNGQSYEAHNVHTGNIVLPFVPFSEDARVDEKQFKSLVPTASTPYLQQSEFPSTGSTASLADEEPVLCDCPERAARALLTSADKWEWFVEGVILSHCESRSKLHRVWEDAKIVSFSDLFKGLGKKPIEDLSPDLFMTFAGEPSVRTTSCCRRAAMHPYSKKRMILDIVGMVLCLHDVFLLPLQVFDLPAEYWDFRDGYDIMCACFWTCDLAASFFTGYHTAEGIIEVEPLRVARHYIRTWFALDIIVTLSDWASFCLNLSSSSIVRLGKVATRCLRGLRLLRLPKLTKSLTEWLGTMNSEKVYTIMGICKLVVMITIANHYTACIWFFLSDSSSTSQRWTTAFLTPGRNSTGFAYATSLHWALTQFTPASMEVVPQNTLERVFGCCIIITALVVFSSFVSSVTQAMTHLRKIHARQTEQECLVRRFFSEYSINRELAGRVKHFLRQHHLMSGKRTKEKDVPAFRLLPRFIREELRQEAFMPFLCAHPFFSMFWKLDPKAVRRLCNSGIEEMSMLPMEELFWHGDDVSKMIFVAEGAVKYHHSDCHILGPIDILVGEWACEETLWAAYSMLSGPFVAGPSGCELINVIPSALHAIGRVSSELGFLVKYAEIFISAFNNASKDEHCMDLLFNSPSVIVDLCMKATEGRTKSVQDLNKHSVNSSGSKVQKMRQSVKCMGDSMKQKFHPSSVRKSAVKK